MQVDRKYYCNNTIHIDLLQKADDPSNNVLSCGFLYNQGSVQKNINFKYYGGLYVVSGTGVYIDAKSGKEYPVYPGCIVQRMPGVRHHSIITEGAEWLEYYFCAGAKVFETLKELNLITDDPVFYIGEKEEVFNRLLEYHHLFSRSSSQNAAELIIEFQKLLCYLNDFKDREVRPEWIDFICEKLRNNYKVGDSVKNIAKECGVGYETVRKAFPKYFGCSLEKYRISVRINQAKNMLIDRNMPIKEVAFELGYCDVYAFCKQFKQQEGIPPGEFVAIWKRV